MITVYFDNTTPYIVRPTPFVSIATQPIRNKVGYLGSTYTITLTGTILAEEGSPFWSSGAGGYSTSSVRPDRESVPVDDKLHSILVKQNMLRQLFARDGQRVEISNAANSREPAIVFYATLQSIDFEEGPYVDICRYTVTLEATSITNSAGELSKESKEGLILDSEYGAVYGGGNTENDIITNYGGIVEDYQESWSIETDENGGETDSVNPTLFIPRSYTIVRNVSATGRTTYINGVKQEAWVHAREFLKKNFIDYTATRYPDYPLTQLYGKDALDLIGYYGGFNHVRSENIDKTNGSVSYTDTWLICRDVAFENYNFNTSFDNQNSFVQITIDGTIKGIDGSSAGAMKYGGTNVNILPSKIDNALTKWQLISSDQQWGYSTPLYLRAQTAVNNGITFTYPVVLNPEPQSITISRNDFTGEIGYSIQYNNRPTNVISSALSESISVQDTYPGDLYTLIPVIGRPTGPILQYIGGRTEYRRNINIELVFPYANLNSGTNRTALLLTKPTLYDPPRSEINNLIKELSPLNEPGIRKCFLDPPQESWNPREGRYSLTLSWVYELEK